jgi:hypothetical protein
MVNLIFLFPKMAKKSPKNTNKNSFFHLMKNKIAQKKHQWTLGMF